jgi:hypothetical protein
MSGRIVKEVEIRIGKNRRITLPPDFKVNNGDILKAGITEQGNLFLVPVVTATTELMDLYACPIGEYNGRYFGVVVDRNGTVAARVNSSNREFLITDLTIPKMKNLDNKLNSRYGIHGWHWPKYVDFNAMPAMTIAKVLEIQKELKAGTWPPERN